MTVGQLRADGCSCLCLYQLNHFSLCNDALQRERFYWNVAIRFNAIKSCDLLCKKLISPEVMHSAHMVIIMAGSGCCINR